MADRRYSYSDSKFGSSSDNPPNSRLFLVTSKQLTEEDFRNAFSKFGEIEEIWVVKDRQTGERKGVTYIKFAKTSDAARALESMNGKIIGNSNRPAKVMIASRREQGSKRDENEEEKSLRLFVLIPKTMTEDELHEYFKQFGAIDYATVIRDKKTRESKGLAYIKYFKFSHAALAFEQSDKKYKAVFAEPRSSKRNTGNEYSENNMGAYDSFGKVSNMSLPLPDVPSEGYTKLSIITSPSVNQDQLWKLFDIVPGMDYCNLRHDGHQYPVRGIATVAYTHPQWASYAREKLHGFEFPPGSRLIVRPEFDASRSFNDGRDPRITMPSVSHSAIANNPDIKQLAETIAQATSIIQAAGLSPDLLQSKFSLLGSKDDQICNVPLPDPQPVLHIDYAVAARCFVVCTPHPPPVSVLKDVFSRFGNLIEIYMLQKRNCGYAKYGTKKSAEDAIKTLNGAEICGIRMKVIEAEERDNQRKRLRLDDGPME